MRAGGGVSGEGERGGRTHADGPAGGEELHDGGGEEAGGAREVGGDEEPGGGDERELVVHEVRELGGEGGGDAAALRGGARSVGGAGAVGAEGAHHGYAGDVGAGPADVLHEEGELGGVEGGVVGGLGGVGVAAAVEIWGRVVGREGAVRGRDAP